MCGVIGYWQPKELDVDEATQRMSTMTEALAHRGPDDVGHFLDVHNGLALGHRRLSILDLSPAGHQPMVSNSGRFVMVYNGEVYNFPSLRRDLEAAGVRFHSHTDTEVILEGCERWGVEATLNKLNGMFAFALWDRHARSLMLARDRLGIKPLYFGRLGRTFFFSSELGALRRHPDFTAHLNRNSLALFFRHNCIPAPHTIFQGMFKLRPGHWLTRKTPRDDSSSRSYWSIPDVIQSANGEPVPKSIEEAEEQLDVLLRDAVAKRMIADVPLGAFLSGGVDSSLIVSLMQSQARRAVKTFSIGFHEDGYNEAVHAKSVAAYLGTDHTELYITPAAAQEVIPQLGAIFDEPFSDSSQIPTLLVSRLAREHVTVSLSGDGGDEIFGGYTRYRRVSDLWRRIGWMPLPVRRLAARGVRAVPWSVWDRATAWLSPEVYRSVRSSGVAERFCKLAEFLDASSQQRAYRQAISHWKEPTQLVSQSFEPPTELSESSSVSWLTDPARQLMYLDLTTYLPDDILTKLDRTSMAVSLEARVPLLDYRVVEFAWKLPTFYLIQRGRGKHLLRRTLERYVPTQLWERPKHGFAVPIRQWLGGPLREWAEDLLDEGRLRREGYLRPELVLREWREYLGGASRRFSQLWDVLMFQAWVDRWLRT